MDFYTITENGSIRCTFATMKRLCVFAFLTTLTKWATEDSLRVPESEHNRIEDIFTNLLSFVLSIESTDENQDVKFRSFDNRLENLVATIDALKE